jgi:hypothetical protein
MHDDPRRAGGAALVDDLSVFESVERVLFLLGGRVRVVKPVEGFANDAEMHAEREARILAPSDAGERHPVEVVHHHERTLLVLANLVDCHDVRVNQARGQPRLLNEGLEDTRARSELRLELFQDVELPERIFTLGQGQVDDSHATSRDFRNELPLPEMSQTLFLFLIAQLLVFFRPLLRGGPSAFPSSEPFAAASSIIPTESSWGAGIPLFPASARRHFRVFAGNADLVGSEAEDDYLRSGGAPLTRAAGSPCGNPPETI